MSPAFHLPGHGKWQVAVSLGVFLFYALTFAVPSGYSYGAGLLFLTSLAFLFSRPRTFPAGANQAAGRLEARAPGRWRLTGEDKAIGALLLLVFLVSLAIVLLHGDKLKMLDQSSRCLLLLPVLWLLLNQPPRLGALWGGLCVGAISAGAVALWQHYGEGNPRPDGFMTSAIPFGDISLMTGMLCLAGMPWAARQLSGRRLWQLMLSIAFLGGLYASFISGSRGGWLALPVVLVLFCAAFIRRRNLRQAAIIGVLLVAAIGVMAGFLQDQIKTRYNEAVTEISQYMHQGNASTSVGIRLEAWRTAAINIAQKPLLGWSYEDYYARLDEQTQRGVAKEAIVDLANTHNNYVEVWLHQGVFGLLALLALYVVPFWFFCRRLRSDNAVVQALAVGGVSLLASFFVFGLTQVILGRNNGILFFALTLAIFWAAMRNEEQAAAVSRSTCRNGSWL